MRAPKATASSMPGSEVPMSPMTSDATSDGEKEPGRAGVVVVVDVADGTGSGFGGSTSMA